ncbi:hypothetical protein HMI55_006782 [Coelomomyces lativittatus]|nr:hypothetical protein HMI55_006782 [Coelomomyces lativittatus]
MALLLQCSEEVKEPFDAISNWRQLMGPTRPASAQLSHPNSLRGLFALTDVRNALHGSDSPESVYREAQIIFPSINLHTLIQEMRKKSNSIT